MKTSLIIFLSITVVGLLIFALVKNAQNNAAQATALLNATAQSNSAAITAANAVQNPAAVNSSVNPYNPPVLLDANGNPITS